MDAVFELLLGRLVTFIETGTRHILEFPGQLKKTQKELVYMQSYLDDVNRDIRKNHNKTLKMITQDLRKLLYEVEDIVEDCEFMFSKQNKRHASTCMVVCSPSFLKFRYQMGKKLGEKNEEIAHLKSNMLAYLGTLPSSPHPEHGFRLSFPEKYAVQINEAEIVGLDDELKKIKQWILQANGPLTVIGIVGTGGSGKSTLVRKIYKDSENKDFDYTLLVTVSHGFELKEIVRNILKQLGMTEDASISDKNELLEKLRHQLSGRKYLLIVDDVLETNQGSDSWWESLQSGLPQTNNGSCVIVTTRHEEVAKSMGANKKRIHRPQGLSVKDSWSLFTKVAFARNGGQCLDPQLEVIGREIVAQCGGFPLAIKVVGGIMLCKEYSVSEWTKMNELLKEELASRNKDDRVPYLLQLSYLELPKHLKPCILCFSMFPEHYKISLHEMVFWWVSEGFVQETEEKTAYECGKECFNELISRCLLIGVTKNLFERIFIECEVHNMVREMLVDIAKEEEFMGLDDIGRPSFNVQSHRVGFMKNADMNGLDETNFEWLRTLVVKDIVDRDMFISNAIIKLHLLKRLRVLDLSFRHGCIDEREPADWLNGLGSLSHLIHLSIGFSTLETLPNSIQELQNLQILRLFSWPLLTTLPTWVTSLVKLSTLETFSCGSLEYLPKGIGSLLNLQNLGGFKPATARAMKEGCRLSELKNLTKLRQLTMSLDSEDQIEERELQVLSELNHLELLYIDFGKRSTKELARKVGHDISPLQKVKELSLINFPGETTPLWLNPTTFPKLCFLSIKEGYINRMSPGFFGKEENKNWKLEGMSLQQLEKLKKEDVQKIQKEMQIPTLRIS